MHRPTHAFLLAVAATTVAAAAQTPAAPPAPAPRGIVSAAPQPAERQDASPQLKKGDVAPAFEVLDPKGNPVKLADFAGKIVVVDVSATWCGPCQAAMPNNDRIYKKYKDQGVVLLGITADDSREAYDGWQQRNAGKYEFTMYFDPKGKEHWKESPFQRDYHVTGFPTMFVVGRDGKLVETLSGGGPGEDPRLEYALARAGAKVDLASLPPEKKPDPNGPKSVPMVGKVAAMPMAGMGGAAAPGTVPEKFGNVPRGQEVPDLKFQDADGKPLSLSSLRGKRALVHFVTSGGPQDWFAAIAKDYAAQAPVLVVFSACEKDALTKWVAAHPNPGFAIAFDPAGKAWAESELNTKLGIGMYPATIVLDAEGKLAGGTIGMGERAALTIKACLAAAAVKLTDADAAALAAAKQAGADGRAPVRAVAAMPLIRPAGGDAPAAPQLPLLTAGTVAPDFVSTDAAGKQVHLADYAGKIVILDFWATWCGPCKASLPHTQTLAKELAAQGVVVLMGCTSDTREAFDKWTAANATTYPDLVFTCDPNERGSPTFADRASAKLYHVADIPTKFVIGRDGKIVGSVVGYEEGDVRTESVLADAGVKIDAEVAAKGKAKRQKDAEEEAERAKKAGR